jgi:hypothetical protein
MSRYSAKRQIGYALTICLSLMVYAGPAWSADRYLIGPATLQASRAVPQSVVNGVNPQGWVLYTQSYGIKDLICEIFLAKTVTASSAPSSGKMLYSALEEGAFVGVIHLLPEATEDYSADAHNQKLKPGFYTMRYAVMPAGTYEHGTKPGDFLVLSAASTDPDPTHILKATELKRLGVASSGTAVAASVELVAADSAIEQSPTVKMDETFTCIFQARLQLDSGKGSSANKLPLAIALLTPLHGPEGS